MLRVQIHLYSQSQPIERENVVNTYVKSGMYCLMLVTEDVEKYPLQHIFRVKEKDTNGNTRGMEVGPYQADESSDRCSASKRVDH